MDSGRGCASGLYSPEIYHCYFTWVFYMKVVFTRFESTLFELLTIKKAHRFCYQKSFSCLKDKALNHFVIKKSLITDRCFTLVFYKSYRGILWGTSNISTSSIDLGDGWKVTLFISRFYTTNIRSYKKSIKTK